MSGRGRDGKQQWRDHQQAFADNFREDIEADAATRLRRWQQQGRIPWWLRTKWRIQGRDPHTGKKAHPTI